MSLSNALLTGDLNQLPGRRDEDWRWTDLRGVIKTAPPRSPIDDRVLAAGPFGSLEGQEILIINGQSSAGLELVIAPDTRQVVRLRLVSTTDGTSHTVAFKVKLGAGAELVLLESHEGLADGYISSVDLDFDLAEGGRLERIVIADDGAHAISVNRSHVVMGPKSSFSQSVLTRGARRQRIETVLVHPGAEAQVEMNGVYLLDGQRHADITTSVEHAGPGGVTRQLTKGVVRDQSRGVFQGRILVDAGADQTEAKMGHHALILSDRAEVDARPELLIHADDVQCAHGNTIGALDEEALFYMCQRGLPEEEARSLLIAAFVDEVVCLIRDSAAQDCTRTWISDARGRT